jgi:nucleoside-diphosphate-sugar epimerase
MRDRKVVYVGDGSTVLNNTYVGNLVDAIFLALGRQGLVGEFFNIRDERLVTKREFFETIAELGGLPKPSREIPLAVAKPLATGWEWLWRTIGQESAPLLSQATVKFLGYHLDYSIDKAKQKLRYQPRVDFREGIKTTMDWYRMKGKV